MTGFLHESKLYGRVRSGRRTVPSAGAFYSLVIHVLAPRQVGQLPAGIYLVGAEAGIPVRAIGGVDEASATRLLGLPGSAVPLLGITLGT